jgi:single-strand DNA-binding protein
MPDHLNEVHIIGTLSWEPEFKIVKDGLHLAKFSITTRVGRGKTWVNFIAWAEVAEEMSGWHLNKGDWLEVWGKLKSSSWDSDTGKRYKTEVVASEIKSFGSEEAEGAGQEQEIPAESGAATDQTQPDRPAPPPAEDDDDLPF